MKDITIIKLKEGTEESDFVLLLDKCKERKNYILCEGDIKLTQYNFKKGLTITKVLKDVIRKKIDADSWENLKDVLGI